jgi:hypothetical protein
MATETLLPTAWTDCSGSSGNWPGAATNIDEGVDGHDGDTTTNTAHQTAGGGVLLRDMPNGAIDFAATGLSAAGGLTRLRFVLRDLSPGMICGIHCWIDQVAQARAIYAGGTFTAPLPFAARSLNVANPDDHGAVPTAAHQTFEFALPEADGLWSPGAVLSVRFSVSRAGHTGDTARLTAAEIAREDGGAAAPGAWYGDFATPDEITGPPRRRHVYYPGY